MTDEGYKTFASHSSKRDKEYDSGYERSETPVDIDMRLDWPGWGGTAK